MSAKTVFISISLLIAAIVVIVLVHLEQHPLVFTDQESESITIELEHLCTETESETETETEVVTQTETVQETARAAESETKPVYYTSGKKYPGMVMELPTDIPRTFKSGAQWTALKRDNKVQLLAYTDELGFRKVEHYFTVAMGSYYTHTLGDLFHITTEGGEFDVIITDGKSDLHTDARHMYSVGCRCMLEFYCEISMLPKNVRLAGTMSAAYPEFGGAITSVTYLGNYFYD